MKDWASAPQTGLALASTLPANVAPEDIQAQMSLAFMLSREKYRAAEARGLSKISVILSRVLADCHDHVEMSAALLRALQLEMAFAPNEFEPRESRPTIVLANQTCNGSVDSALVTMSIDRLGLLPSVVTAENFIPIPAVNGFIPSAWPRTTEHDTRSPAAIEQSNARAVEECLWQLAEGRGIGIFPALNASASAYPRTAALGGDFDRLLPLIFHGRQMQPHIICINHDYAVPDWWRELAMSDPEMFCAKQWEAALELGPQTVRARVIKEFSVSQTTSWDDLLEIQATINEQYANAQNFASGQSIEMKHSASA